MNKREKEYKKKKRNSDVFRNKSEQKLGDETKLHDKQQILETEPQNRLEKLLELMQAEIEILRVELERAPCALSRLCPALLGELDVNECDENAALARVLAQGKLGCLAGVKRVTLPRKFSSLIGAFLSQRSLPRGQRRLSRGERSLACGQRRLTLFQWLRNWRGLGVAAPAARPDP